MAKQIKKGSEVWKFGDWNQKGTAYARRLTITSLGKKQGTAIRVENGQNYECRIYAQEVERMELVSEYPDPTEFGLAFAAKVIADRVADWENRLAWVRQRNADGLPCAYNERDIIAHIEEAKAQTPAFFIYEGNAPV